MRIRTGPEGRRQVPGPRHLEVPRGVAGEQRGRDAVLYPSAALTLYWICGPQIVASYYFTNAPSGWVKRFHHWGNAPLSSLFLLSGMQPLSSTPLDTHLAWISTLPLDTGTHHSEKKSQGFESFAMTCRVPAGVPLWSAGREGDRGVALPCPAVDSHVPPLPHLHRGGYAHLSKPIHTHTSFSLSPVVYLYLHKLIYDKRFLYKSSLS